jgi:uncharacterized protein YdhG (YjbR/CyaY superfamily)
MKQYKDVESYINDFPPPTQALLKDLRNCILKNSPGVLEHISYGMPAYKLNGPLIYLLLMRNILVCIHREEESKNFASYLALTNYPKELFNFHSTKHCL